MSLPFTLQNPVSRLIDKENINDMIFLFLLLNQDNYYITLDVQSPWHFGAP